MRKILTLALLLQAMAGLYARADFVNGRFEATYTPDATTCSPITGWTQVGYNFPGTGSSSPQNINDLALSSSGGSGTQFCGVSDIVVGTAKTVDDYFLAGALPTPDLLVPAGGTQAAIINLRSINAPLAKSGSYAISGWTSIPQQATSFSQQFTVQSGDVDASDGKVHIRFLAAPVLENPGHPTTQQPFMAFQINNITTGRTGSNPLSFIWNYGGQPGVPWQSLTQAGSNVGSRSDYLYTNWQAFDIAPGNAFIHVGDVVELVAIVAGCAAGGHDGHLYLDDVGTGIPSGLWISATGPASTTPGSDITYKYTFINNGVATLNNVVFTINLPVQGTPSSLPADSTTFVSLGTPTMGSCTGTGPITCTISTMQPSESGSVDLTVNVPSGWATSTGPVNNGDYPISATNIAPLLGPLVQTALVTASSLSNLSANISGLPTTATVGVPYSGSFTCQNTATSNATADATNASCDLANLPAGLSVTGCSISPSSTAWTQPATIPMGETVTCLVGGTPTTEGSVNVTLLADADNNSNSTDNQKNATIVVSGTPLVSVPATLDGVPVVQPVVICCGRPVILGDLPVAGDGPTVYVVTARTGDAQCKIGRIGNQTYLKMVASHGGSCTVVGTKNNVSSLPFTIEAP